MELQVDHFDKLAKLKSLWVESRVENENFKMEKSQTLKKIKMKWILIVLLNLVALQLFIAAFTCEVWCFSYFPEA